MSLTEAGRGKVGEFRTVLDETERRQTAGLSAQERAQLEKLLAHIIANLENEVNNP